MISPSIQCDPIPSRTANFLYVTMEHMKRLGAEVLELVTALGGNAGMEMRPRLVTLDRAA